MKYVLKATYATPADWKKDVIQEMAMLKKKGNTYAFIAGYLNDQNIQTFSGKGEWYAQSVHRMLKSAKKKRNKVIGKLKVGVEVDAKIKVQHVKASPTRKHLDALVAGMSLEDFQYLMKVGADRFGGKECKDLSISS